jgi:hypothetical protein
MVETILANATSGPSTGVATAPGATAGAEDGVDEGVTAAGSMPTTGVVALRAAGLGGGGGGWAGGSISIWPSSASRSNLANSSSKALRASSLAFLRASAPSAEVLGDTVRGAAGGGKDLALALDSRPGIRGGLASAAAVVPALGEIAALGGLAGLAGGAGAGEGSLAGLAAGDSVTGE